MKYLLTLIVCALLTVGLIFSVELLDLLLPDPKPWPDWPSSTAMGIGFGLILLIGMGLPIVILVATIFAAIGFTKTVNRWIAENNQSDDCPHILHTRTAAERDAAIKEYQENR